MLAAGCRQRLAGFWGKRDRDQKDHDHAKCEAQGVNPAFVSHPHHPLSQGSGQPPVRNRRPAGKSPATFIIRALSKAVNLLGRILWFSCFSGCFGLDFSRAAPEQHRHLPDLREEPGNSAPSLFSLSCFHIHSKTACRGFESFCPCHKTGRNTAFLPVFFLHVLYGYGVHTGSDSGFSHPFVPAYNRSHPLQHLKRTRFCPFSAFPGAFLCFLPFWTRKIFRLVFVHSDS